ncbi:putative mitochondrial protein [Cucumis melo var. makuwa]|uniref:Mitochondrial protein n=1 Tax=Cucumis melo var. makuwa TaxID=1194695 RepID=A0A5A7VEQ5_CUCMM|nr:putative mitochondrial protein [Cucumis melo var. makuwa]TYK08222.1 putative mitochondrial protein [Cucumis melo var. makuwa]
MNDELQALEKTHIWDYIDLLSGYFQETFAHVARMTSVRSLLIVATTKQLPFLQMNVTNDFLNGILSEEVHMKRPYSTSPPPHKTPQGIVLLLLHVNDVIITSNDPQAIFDLQHYLLQHFEMKDLGSLSYFLGLEISRRSEEYWLSQAKYAFNLLESG